MPAHTQMHTGILLCNSFPQKKKLLPLNRFQNFPLTIYQVCLDVTRHGFNVFYNNNNKYVNWMKSIIHVLQVYVISSFSVWGPHSFSISPMRLIPLLGFMISRLWSSDFVAFIFMLISSFIAHARRALGHWTTCRPRNYSVKVPCWFACVLLTQSSAKHNLW